MLPRGQALGLTVLSDIEVAGLASGRSATGRSVEVVHVPEEELDARWSRADPEHLAERRGPDGAPVATIDHDPEVGYRIEVSGHGSHLVAPDGAQVRSSVAAIPEPRRLRLLHAQVLPLAATLQGHEILHAGAVAVDGRAIALVSPSGGGKSSLVAWLVAGGADFLTDDALAVTVDDGLPVAHPGPCFASVPEHELADLHGQARERLGRPLGTSDKPHLAPRGLERPVPLVGIALVVRADAGPPSATPERGNPRDLLGATFVPFVHHPARLARQLDVCAQVAASVPAWRVSIPSGAHASNVAALLRETLLAP